MSAVVGMRLLTTARASWGTALLLSPSSVICAATNASADGPTRTVARILGARQLVEAALTGRRHYQGAILVGAAVDATHAATFAAVALIRPDRRRLALTNVATATAFAVAGLLESRWARADAQNRN